MATDTKQAERMADVKITAAMRRTLEYTRDHQPVSMWPFSLTMVKRAQDAGFIEPMKATSGGLQLTKYRLTDAGRAAITKDSSNG